MERLFDGIPLDRGDDVDDDQRAGDRAARALHRRRPRSRASPPAKLRGTIQNDMLKEYIAQKEWICAGPRPSMRIIRDMLEYCTTRDAALEHDLDQRLPHPRGGRDGGAGAGVHARRRHRLRASSASRRGLDVDEFAPRLSFFFDVHNDFFEEIAKFRAARRIWARIMRERFGAKNPRSWLLRTHAQTAGVSLTAQQPLNNVVRTTLQALAAVLGGTQSLHTNSLDETYALPTEEAATLALRTQQVIAEEIGRRRRWSIRSAAATSSSSSPIRWKRPRWPTSSKIDEMGGIVRAVEEGYPQREIANVGLPVPAAGRHAAAQRSSASTSTSTRARATRFRRSKIDYEVERAQIERIKKIKASRDARGGAGGARRRQARRRAATSNLVEAVLEAVKKDVTIGEVSDVFRQVWGEHRDPAYL